MGALSYSQALACLLADAAPLPAVDCALTQACGAVLAGAVHAGHAQPPFDNAAMDGFALDSRAGGLEAGSEHAIGARQRAGQGPAEAAGAVEIMTGAMLPAGLDTVVPVERTQVLARDAGGRPVRMRLCQAVAAGANVRLAGQDVQAGEQLLDAGTRLDAAAVMLLAATGTARVRVRRPVRVALVGTGDELVTDPAHPLRPGQIHASNLAYLAAALAGSGVQLVLQRHVGDAAAAYLHALDEAAGAGADLVVSTGAVSMGSHDFVPAAVRQAGARVVFHKAAIRPGAPLLAARLASGPRLLALPGNPMAAVAGLRFFGAPLLRALSGQAAEPVLHARLEADVQGKPGLDCFLRACVRVDADGRLGVRALAGQEPFRIMPLVHANAWLMLGPDQPCVAAGQVVRIAGAALGGGLDVLAPDGPAHAR